MSEEIIFKLENGIDDARRSQLLLDVADMIGSLNIKRLISDSENPNLSLYVYRAFSDTVLSKSGC